MLTRTIPPTLCWGIWVRQRIGSPGQNRAQLLQLCIDLLVGGERIPIRVPLGADAYGTISMELESIKKDLEELKDISLGVGDAKQLDSISFLQLRPGRAI